MMVRRYFIGPSHPVPGPSHSLAQTISFSRSIISICPRLRPLEELGHFEDVESIDAAEQATILLEVG